jgi:hypothetical protein
MFYVDSALSDEGHVLHSKLFGMWDFAMMFYGAVEGLLKSVIRGATSFILNSVFVARTDIPLLPASWWIDDVCYYSYLNMVRVAELHGNPVMHAFVAVLVEQTQLCRVEGSLEKVRTEEARRKRRARTRWHLMYTLWSNRSSGIRLVSGLQVQ